MNVTFAATQIADADMSFHHQHYLLANQATAVVVASYLDYAARVVEAGEGVDSGSDALNDLRIRPSELPSLIDSVQNALKAFTD